MKKRWMTALACAMAGALTLGLAGCNVSSAPDDSSSSSAGVESGMYSSVQEFLAAQETPSTYERRLYEEAVADGYEGTYYDFLAAMDFTDDTAYINRAVNSVVEITVTFTINNIKREASGSGVIYWLDKEAGDAYIVTNYHVISTYLSSGFGPWGTHSSTTDWTNIYLTTYSGETIRSEDVTLVAGSNTDTDLAVLKVTGSEDLRESDAVAATMAEASVGETVYAIGNANGEGTSVTKGIVSLLSEEITVTGADNYSLVSFNVMRTDAAVNQGNSGGGLFNARGELVGIVSARLLASETGVDVDGFGYAIPVADVNAMLEQFGTETIASSDAQVSGTDASDAGQAAAEAASSVVAIETGSAAGSGVIWSLDEAEGDAVIVTNYHVVYSTSEGDISDTISVCLYGDESATPITAEFVGGVQSEDLAVIRIEDCALLEECGSTAVTLADSDSVTLSETVYAIGNAAGDGISVTAGIASVVNETILVSSADGQSAVSITGIRTDADVNHGNSGGGLFNEMGEFLGIVSARSDTDGVVGVGAAIASNHVAAVVGNLLWQAERGNQAASCVTLGITILAENSGRVFDEQTGKVYLEEKVVVQSLTDGSLAARMGMDVNDTLLAARIDRDGQTVRAVSITTQEKLPTMLYHLREGDTLTILVSRGGEAQELSVTVEAGDFQTRA